MERLFSFPVHCLCTVSRSGRPAQSTAESSESVTRLARRLKMTLSPDSAHLYNFTFAR